MANITNIKVINSGSDRLVYLLDGFWREVGDHRVHSRFPLMSGGPVPVILIVCLYLYLVRHLGPKLMQSRKAYNLKGTMRTYNVLLVIGNFIGFCRAGMLTNFGFNYFGCKQVETSAPEEYELMHWGYLFFVSKFFEFLDTIFFVMRKKYNQVSNLHLFHHSCIAVFAWMYFKIAPGGSSVMFPFINAGIHFVMYGYYLLATSEAMRKRLWWKRHLTEAQIVQFVLTMVHFSIQIVSNDCNYPPLLSIIGFAFNLVFLVLFCDFYIRTYSKKASTTNDLQQQHLQQKKSI